VRRTAIISALALTLSLGGTASALPSATHTTAGSAAVQPVELPVLSSENVTYHGTIPLDVPGVGGEVVVREDLGGRKLFYMTGQRGLSIYDVSEPAAPVRIGHVFFPHSQNEDLKVSDDGTRAVIAADGRLAAPIAPATTGIHVVDTTDPTAPRLAGSTNRQVNLLATGEDRPELTGRVEHTAECADADCEWIYGANSGVIYDATDPGNITDAGHWTDGYRDATELPDRAAHALNRDESGLVISDSMGGLARLVLDPVGVIDPDATPDNPTLLTTGMASAADNGIQHNNVRVDPLAWESRDPDAEVETVDVSGIERDERYHVSVVDERPVLRPGELMLGNTETNLNTGCTNAGGLSTWSMVNFDHGAEMVQLEVFRPFNGNWVDEGRPAANALGCSGHWFTVSDDIVAASWYEHGVRFFTVDRQVGTLAEIGWFQPVGTESGAAYWVDDEYVYSVDYARGIDILSFDRDPDLRPSASELHASWLANAGRVGTTAALERLLCTLE
jgi:hypothetical protein